MAASPPPNQDVPPAQASSSDPSFTFRIQRVQQWTLGAVVVAAVSLGIWIGSLTTKLDHIERFVNSAEDASAGVFVRLATIQKTLDLLDKGGNGESRKAAGNVAPYPPINVRVPPIEVRSNSAPQVPVLDKLVEYRILTEFLKPESNGSESAPPSAPAAGVAPKNLAPKDAELSRQQFLWLDEVKQTALKQLQDLDNEVERDKDMTPATKERLSALIDVQRRRVMALNP